MLSGFVPSALVFLSAIGLSSAATLDDLRQLEITCYVPSYLTQGLRLQNVEITYDEIQESEDQNHPLPLYAIQYGNGWNATFTIESAREGIGDRNIVADEENAEETEIKSPFGPMYLIYRPKGKDGRKDEIIANWVSDANMNDEKANAVEKNGNQFNEGGLKQDGEWLSYSLPDTGGFMRYRVLETKGNRYKIEYQENGGGTLTTAATIEFEIEKRHIRRNGSPMTIRVLRVSSYTQK